MKILVTGGCGFIGSHTALTLLQHGHDVFVVDNLSNSHAVVLERVERLAKKQLRFAQGDVCDKEFLFAVCEEYKPDACIHFAGLKAVGESSVKPLEYYKNNIGSTLSLLSVLRRVQCKNLVFSSSATVYGDAKNPITEESPTVQPTNPYGQSKLMIENILQDMYAADSSWNIALLRYFNPIGAHESGQLGEDPCGIPNNLVPYISQVAVGKREVLSVFGNDYPTIDGTGVRDYIHVMDLAEGHVAALKKLATQSGLVTYNLGTGQGYSVLQMVHAFEKVNGLSVPYKIMPRRSGDIAACYADPTKAAHELGWKATRTLEDMMRDTWNWQKQNPNGYLTV